jgi:hypothetical protein
VSAVIYLEGGGDSKDLHARCREGFRKLLEACGFKGRMPRLFASGGRAAAFDDFKTAHENKQSTQYVAMLVDSEDVLEDVEASWKHLDKRDGWKRPHGAEDEQVLLMTTCMETWIVADRVALTAHYGSKLQDSALPPTVDLEKRAKNGIQTTLCHATRECVNAYSKGKRSFEVLAKLDPTTLEQYLPSFKRACRILKSKL